MYVNSAGWTINPIFHALGPPPLSKKKKEKEKGGIF